MWAAGQTLNGNGLALLCPTSNIATPAACPRWINGNGGTDRRLNVELCNGML